MTKHGKGYANVEVTKKTHSEL